MQLFFLAATGSDAFEIVVAFIIIVLTIVALFFLYRNVAHEIEDLRKERQARKEREEDVEEGELDEMDLITDSQGTKPGSLLAQVNKKLRQSKEGSLSTLYVINIDNFANVLTHHDQKTADKILMDLEKKFKKYSGKDALTSYYQHDELLYYYNGIIDADVINKIGEDLLEIVRSPLKGYDDKLTASIGVAVFPYDGINAEQLYKNCKLAVYVAKKQGKDRVHMYSEDLIDSEQSNNEYYQEIKKSISNNEFLLFYQAIVDIKTGKIIGLESLLRWNHPTKGILPPGKFLNVMELTGDIRWFGKWGFEKNVSQYKTWSSKARIGDLFLSTNLSPRQLEEPDLAEQLYAITKKYGLSPEHFCLEIIDYYDVIHSHNCLNNISKFRKYGFRVAVDDMGEHYQIIGDMKNLRASILKLSRDIVLKIMDKTDDIGVIKHAIREAKEKSKIIIAEGVENEEMIETMYELGIRFMQGYYFNQPKSVIEIEKMVMEPPWDMDYFDHITEKYNNN